MKLNEAISRRIKELLREKEISQYMLEKNACIPHRTMVDVANAKREGCNIKTLMLIISALNITPSDFFSSHMFENEELEID